MRNRAIVLILFLGMATAASAGEKAVVDRNTSVKLAGLDALNGALDLSSPTYNRIYSTAAAAGCGAPVVDSLNDDMAFELICIKAVNGNPIELIVNPASTNIIDTVLTLYCDPFDPVDPTRGVVAFDDDDGVGTLSAFTAADNIRLVPGIPYWLVVSTYAARMYGNFSVQVSGNVYSCDGVASESSTWGGVKGLFR